MKPIILLVVLASSLLTSAFAVAECTANRNVDITITKPDSLYTDHGDGTVTDNATGLMWQKCSLGLSGSSCAIGTAQGFTWQAALSAANNNTDNGYSDWRLPNKNELESLAEIACIDPAINATVFPGTVSDNYWSSSPMAGDDTGALVVYFGWGSVNGYGKNNAFYYVRLVRGN